MKMKPAIIGPCVFRAFKFWGFFWEVSNSPLLSQSPFSIFISLTQH